MTKMGCPFAMEAPRQLGMLTQVRGKHLKLAKSHQPGVIGIFQAERYQRELGG